MTLRSTGGKQAKSRADRGPRGCLCKLSLVGPAAPADLAPGFLRLYLALHAGGHVVLAALNLLEDTVALAVVLEAPERLFNGFFVSYFDKYHADHHLLVCILKILSVPSPGARAASCRRAGDSGDGPPTARRLYRCS